MADHTRAARLAQRIKVILAEALQKTIKDDRIDNVTL
ncbi:MAG: ribosome-binding factor A, partial [Micrococcus sp.]|nr:ribosome-binding factor A [Micrococcus sp.]